MLDFSHKVTSISNNQGRPRITWLAFMVITSHQILSLYVANCMGTRHRSFTFIDVVLTQATLYRIGWGAIFNPIFEIKLDDIAFMQLPLSTIILQFLSLIFIHVWVNRIFRLCGGTSDDSNTPNNVKKLLVFRIILRIATLISYERNFLLRLVLHHIWLIIQKNKFGIYLGKTSLHTHNLNIWRTECEGWPRVRFQLGPYL